MKTILILGAGVMQVPGVRIARRKGWRVILADGNPRRWRATWRTSSRRRPEGPGRAPGLGTRMRGPWRAGRRLHRGDGFFFLRGVGGGELGLPGIPFDTAMRATDKCLMREAFAEAGVPSPRFACWNGQGTPGRSSRPGWTSPSW